METCDKDGMDPKVADCLSGLESKVMIEADPWELQSNI